MGESRNDLIAWINDLSQLGITKIEQCGTGIVQCVIMDSIYRDVPLKKVKFNAKHEYEYIANFKVLQAVFDKHKVDQNIPIERLAKCKMQDNLEFVQWLKKLSVDKHRAYWDQYYPGGEYDAIARRAASPTGSAGNLARGGSGAIKGSAGSIATGMKKTLSTPSVAASAPPAKKAPSRLGMASNSAAARNAQLEEEYQRNMADMTQQNMELKLTVEQVEKEREFYFSKLREIEVFVQEQMENAGAMGVEQVLEHIQGIMYKTEDGFEIPDAVDEEETF
ncbi:calponin homology domain-containing protein [Chytriomyces sp. MP71]|nr:calponin homology domain-containing protein [Chytriomyces sp. MP71]